MNDEAVTPADGDVVADQPTTPASEDGDPAADGPTASPPASAPSPDNPPRPASQGPNQATPTAARADVERRLAALRAEKDKVSHEKAQLALDLANTRKELTELRGRQQAIVDGAGKTVEDALNRQKELEVNNDNLRAELARLKVLAENPDLQAYAALIPVTADEAQLQETVERLRRARESDLASVRDQIRAGQVPSSNAARIPARTDPEAINRYLKEAYHDPEEYRRRLEAVILHTNTQLART